jgi:chromosome segregation ATPase
MNVPELENALASSRLEVEAARAALLAEQITASGLRRKVARQSQELVRFHANLPQDRLYTKTRAALDSAQNETARLRVLLGRETDKGRDLRNQCEALQREVETLKARPMASRSATQARVIANLSDRIAKQEEQAERHANELRHDIREGVEHAAALHREVERLRAEKAKLQEYAARHEADAARLRSAAAARRADAIESAEVEALRDRVASERAKVERLTAEVTGLRANAYAATANANAAEVARLREVVLRLEGEARTHHAAIRSVQERAWAQVTAAESNYRDAKKQAAASEREAARQGKEAANLVRQHEQETTQLWARVKAAESNYRDAKAEAQELRSMARPSVPGEVDYKAEYMAIGTNVAGHFPECEVATLDMVRLLIHENTTYRLALKLPTAAAVVAHVEAEGEALDNG